ncbi:MAG: hypothetical protein PHI68_03745 [Candidatus Cloacimonetes bacterium]|nr:hypothetical protein [Candidatus Cloacimonadota bacterium]
MSGPLPHTPSYYIIQYKLCIIYSNPAKVLRNWKSAWLLNDIILHETTMFTVKVNPMARPY